MKPLAYFFSFVFLLNTSCGPSANTPSAETRLLPQKWSENSERITIMTWNVENLFDTEDDPKKDDDTFLPLSVKEQIANHIKNCENKGAYSWFKKCTDWDWNEDVLKTKIRKLGRVIQAVNNGRGPDILFLQEVENLQVLQRLVKEGLKDPSYKAYLLENNDARGIDVGLITRLSPLTPPKLESLGSSRPALTVDFQLSDGSVLHMAGVHFPISPTPIKRRLKMLSHLSAKSLQSHYTIALGDFNFPKKDQESTQLFPRHINPYWISAHQYCVSCLGTTYENYTQDWSFLDLILLSKNFSAANSRWTLDPSSVEVFNQVPFQNNKYGSPADFVLPGLYGVSDHWPLVLQIVRTDHFI